MSFYLFACCFAPYFEFRGGWFLTIYISLALFRDCFVCPCDLLLFGCSSGVNVSFVVV